MLFLNNLTKCMVERRLAFIYAYTYIIHDVTSGCLLEHSVLQYFYMYGSFRLSWHMLSLVVMRLIIIWYSGVDTLNLYKYIMSLCYMHEQNVYLNLARARTHSCSLTHSKKKDSLTYTKKKTTTWTECICIPLKKKSTDNNLLLVYQQVT